MGGQLADKPYRVREERRPARREGERTDGRVERGEESRGGGDVRAGQGVEERRLAGVRVAHQRHQVELARASITAVQRALGADALDGLGQRPDASANPAAVEFELLLAGPARADAAAQAR